MKHISALVGLSLCLLTGCREPATSDPVEIEALCRAVHSPNPGVTQACKASPTLTLSELREVCTVHLRDLTHAGARSYELCLERVEQEMPMPWLERVWRDLVRHH